MKTIYLLLLFGASAFHLSADGMGTNERGPLRRAMGSNSYGSVAILPRGPLYGPASPAGTTGDLSLGEVKQLVADQSGASPDGLVVKATTNSDPCQGDPGLDALQSQMQDFMSRANALLSQLNAFNAEAARLNTGIMGCGSNVACINSWNAQISVHNAQLPALMAQVNALLSTALALSGQYMALQSSSPCRSGTTQPGPAGQSLANFARRLGIQFPASAGFSGAGGGGSRSFAPLGALGQDWGADAPGSDFDRLQMQPWRSDPRNIDFWQVNMRPFELEQGRFASLQLQAAALEQARQKEAAMAAPDKGPADPDDADYHQGVTKRLEKGYEDMTVQLSETSMNMRSASLTISAPPPPQLGVTTGDSDEGASMWSQAEKAGAQAAEWLKDKAVEKAVDKGEEKGNEIADEAGKEYLGEERAEAMKKIIKTDQNVFEYVGQSFETMGKMAKGDFSGAQSDQDKAEDDFKWNQSEILGGPKKGFFGAGS